jgi:hypothetical protein
MPKHPKKAPSESAQPPKPPVRPHDDTDLVLTPGGLRPRSLVHQLEPGQHVSVKGGRVRIIETATGNVVKDLGEAGSEEGDTEPPPSNVPHPVPGLPDLGYIEKSYWQNSGAQPIVSFSTTWVVPPVPASSDGQTIYLFNALTPNSGAHILQPVLQWGTSPSGGGNYWSIANYYADGQGGPAASQPAIRVNPGDVLQGVITCAGQSGTEFNYTSSFVGYPAADTTVTDVDELTWAYEALECYGPYDSNTKSFSPLAQCSDYPNTTLTAMYDIEIKTGTPGSSGTDATIAWTPVTSFTDCGQNCQIVSNDSPGGAVYLYYKESVQNFYFIIDKGTFGKDEVADVIARSQGLFSAAFYLALEGFTVQQLTVDEPGIIAPGTGGTFRTLSGVTVAPSATYPPVYDSSNLYTPQRILYPFDITFTEAALADFPASGILAEGLSASIDVGSPALGTLEQLNTNTDLFLVAGADPYFTNIDPAQDNAFYLSQDLRVFTVSPETNNATPIDNVPFTFQVGSPTSLDTGAAYAYIQSLIGHFNSTYANPAGIDPFDVANSVLPHQTGAFTGDSSVTPATPNPSNPAQPYQNYNFALARVRLRGSPGTPGDAANVRVFFRVFTTQTFDTDYINVASAVSTGDPNITYPSLPAGSPNAPTSPLPGTDSNGTINGCTLPFFAAADQSDLADGGVNNQTIEIPSGLDAAWAYFGCFLNVYDSSLLIGGFDPQYWFAGSAHNCIVAQIAYSGAPIENLNGVIETPENSNMLAQRNLQITLSGNPGFPETHLVPQTFDTRPSPPPASEYLTNYPDELMIDFRNTPHGSTAEIYWPLVSAADVLALAARLYPVSAIVATDSHTIRCTVGTGLTYIPIPAGGSESFAGLITVQLPNGIRAGNEFNIVIRRVTSRRFDKSDRTTDSRSNLIFNWRYIVGTFQMKIPVKHDAAILPSEENLLAILKWRLQSLKPDNRWYPVLKRYIFHVVGRVRGLGGNPAKIRPSQFGTAGQIEPTLSPPDEERLEWTGKISGLRYDRFGDFLGFDLITVAGEERCFRGREHAIEDLARQAWVERILLTVVGSRRAPEWPAEIMLRRPPRTG